MTMPGAAVRSLRLPALLVTVGLFLAGCAGTSLSPAPVEDRSPTNPPRASQGPAASGAPARSSAGATTPRATSATPPARTPAGANASVRALPGSEFAGQPGYYTVRPGDTLIRIGLEHGQNWRDLAAWSGLDNPNQIEVGQVLRVAPPVGSASGGAPQAIGPVRAVGDAPAAAPPPPASPSPVAPPPIVSTGVAAAPGPQTVPSATPTPVPAGPPAAPTGSAAPTDAARAAGRQVEEALDWAWPASGPLLLAFDEGKGVKGLSLGGRAGDPVLAAADGRVVYAGSGLRGYGNLLIVKHNATYLTAYAHNQTLLVKEDQVVRRGQKIAEMGSTDADRVKLHFEVRRMGRPVDPASLLPVR